MALDAWLDETGGPALERFRLFVAVQLHETPPQNSAEAAVALLLGWAPLAERLELPAIATLHRPVAAAHGLADTIRTAALFGQITPDALTHLLAIRPAEGREGGHADRGLGYRLGRGADRCIRRRA